MAQKAQTRANNTVKEVKQEERSEPSKSSSFPIVGVGASAGGLVAFTELLKHLPLDTGMGFVLVQHLDPQHESALTQLLTRATKMPVREVTNKLRVEANHVYIIPPNTNLALAQGALQLQPRQQTHMPHRSIDFFFESLAEDQRERAIGVILSGTATDGTLGLEAIKAEGGITFAQDESAQYDSMPRSAVAAGCVDSVLSPENIAKELARIAQHPYVAGQPIELLTSPEDDRAEATAHEDPSTLLRASDETPLPSGGRGTPRTGTKQARAEAEAARGKAGENGFKQILLLLRSHSGVDFSLYRTTTIQRRITRRMVLGKQDTLESYAHFLRGNAKELDTLYSDVLISVTGFFRNPEAFDVLRRTVFPKLLQRRGDQPFRVWVLGCSTGQEAYSIAMAFVEAAEDAPGMRKLQVFATDLNDALLDKARHGLYAKTLAQDLSPKRLRRFFVEEEGGYRVVKSLREMVCFARQNLMSDPPFSRMDLISCRNLLIYIGSSSQKKALPTFHYALKPGGFLFLGASESIAGFSHLFEPVDKKHKIYSRKVAITPALRLPGKTERGEHPATGQRPLAPLPMGPGEAPVGFRADLNAQREADRITVNRFAPPGVLIDAELQIVQFRGLTGAYLEPPTGQPSFDVLGMARGGLMLPLRAAITQAKKENKAVRRENVRVEQNGQTRTVNLEVIPLKNLRERSFLILFEETEQLWHASGRAPLPETIEPSGAVPTPSPTAKEESGRVADLEREISEMRDYLQSIQEQYEAANEELQASSEEAQSANEELQSLNEELETSKEELESTNEELTTVNEEMVNRNAELNRLHGDLVNLQTSTKLAVVLLGRNLTIRSFSAPAEKQFHLRATDVGRPIGHVRHNLVFGAEAGGSPESRECPPDLETLIAEVIASVREQECEVRDKDGRWRSLRVRPYLIDKRVDGAVLVLVDIDALKRGEHAIAAARDYAEAIVRTVANPLVILNAELRVDTANDAFYNTFKVEPSESEGRLIYELGNHQWNIPRLRELLKDILPGNSVFDNFEVTHDFETIGRRTMLLNARVLRDRGEGARILLGIQDLTERKQAEDALREAGERKNEFLAMLAHELRNPLAPIRNALHLMRLGGGNSEAVQSASAMMERQFGQMVRLVDDLLDVSRISRGKIELRKGRVELASVVNHAVETARPQCESMDHDLTTTLPPQPVYLNGDPMRLAQVIGNLLSNACKFTDKGGRIVLTVEQEGEQAVIRVRDTGIGIPADQLPRIFDMFMQVDTSLERSVSGLGIGLTVVKNVVEMHGGAVEAHSAGVGQGSEFVVRLPLLVDAPKPSPEPTASEPTATTARRILVVDDNRDAAGSLAMLLQIIGHETHTAHDGLEAVEAAERLRPDVVLLDIGLPQLNGFDAARRIREQPWGKTMVLVAVTGWGQEEDRRKSKDAGFDAHLVKPVDYGTLMKLLGSLPSKEGG